MKDLYLDKNAKHVLISLSGGADSSIIYYNIANFYKNYDTKVHVFTYYGPLKPFIDFNAKRIIDRVTELTGFVPFKHHSFRDPTLTKGERYTEGQEYYKRRIFHEYPIEIHYSGITLNAPDQHFLDYHKTVKDPEQLKMLEHWFDNRPQDRSAPSMPVRRAGKLIVNFPFSNKDKHGVYQAYVDSNILEELYPYTFSCESKFLKKGMVYKNNHCGVCYWCQERLIAFGELK